MKPTAIQIINDVMTDISPEGLVKDLGKKGAIDQLRDMALFAVTLDEKYYPKDFPINLQAQMEAMPIHERFVNAATYLAQAFDIETGVTTEDYNQPSEVEDNSFVLTIKPEISGINVSFTSNAKYSLDLSTPQVLTMAHVAHQVISTEIEKMLTHAGATSVMKEILNQNQ